MGPRVYYASVVVVGILAAIGLAIVALNKDDQKARRSRPAQQPAPPPDPLPPLHGDVMISIDPEILPDGRVRVAGTTNLPKGTELMFTVEEKTPCGSIAQAKGSVLDSGNFQSEPLGQHEGFLEGIYQADVTMPIVRLQPPRVQQVLGEQGENLKGPLVHRGPLGVSARSVTEFAIGGDAAAIVQQERLQRCAKKYQEWYDQLNALYAQLTKMGSERLGSREWENPAIERQWISFARQWRGEMNALAASIDATPQRHRSCLGPASGLLGSLLNAAAFRRGSDYARLRQEVDQALSEMRGFIANLRAQSKAE